MSVKSDTSKLHLEIVKHISNLASLPLTDDGLSTYSEQLGKIIGYFNQLNQVDTEGIEPTFNVTGLENVFRKDSSDDGLSQDSALQNASSTKNGFFITRGVFDE